MKRLMMGLATVLTGAVIAACGATAPTTTSPTSDTGSTSATSATTDTSATTSATSDAMMSGTTEATADAMMSGTTEATADAMMSGTTEATADAMMSGTAMSGTAMSGTAEATADAMMSGTAEATSAAGTSATGNSIVDVAKSQGNFTILLTALQATGLDKTLAEAGTYTVFAPTDEAFAALPQGTLEKLLADPATLTKILSYHVVQTDMKATDVAKATTIPTLEGQSIKVTVSGSTVTLNDSAKVTTADVATSNGTIHVIDKVLLPPDVTL